MSFAPHTDEDVGLMLGSLGLGSLDELFRGVPEALRLSGAPQDIPERLSEPELVSEFCKIGRRNRGDLLCFAGGGSYDSYVPAAVTAIANRPEFATAYTPYQAEVSQGVLQALFEYQSLICRLTDMEVANASLYDGATAVVEAASLAIASTGRNAILVSDAVSPRIREVLSTFAGGPGWEIVPAPTTGGATDWPSIADRIAGVVVQHPNYLGCLEDLELVCSGARDSGAISIVITDPVANGLLKRPGAMGADVAVGEGQTLGSALNFGGPHLGMFATREKYLRLVPGRIVGETIDADGKRSYALALQGREQHIRRDRASSNICTNQTLMAIAAAGALCWLGPAGLKRMAQNSALNAHYLAEQLRKIPGLEVVTEAPYFREFALRLPVSTEFVIDAMAEEGFLAGIPLGRDYPELGDALLIALTEKRTREEMNRYAGTLEKVITR